MRLIEMVVMMSFLGLSARLGARKQRTAEFRRRPILDVTEDAVTRGEQAKKDSSSTPTWLQIANGVHQVPIRVHAHFLFCISRNEAANRSASHSYLFLSR